MEAPPACGTPDSCQAWLETHPNVLPSEFIEHELPAMAAANPQVIFEVRHKGGRHPTFVGEFRKLAAMPGHQLVCQCLLATPFAVNGATKKVCVKNYPETGVHHFATRLLCQDGEKIVRESSIVKTNRPTIQGNWNPFLASERKLD